MTKKQIIIDWIKIGWFVLKEIFSDGSHWHASYSNVWDDMIIERLKKPIFTERKVGSVKLNELEIWTGNFPECYCSPCGKISKGGNVRPSWKTSMRFRYFDSVAMELSKAKADSKSKKDNRLVT